MSDEYKDVYEAARLLKAAHEYGTAADRRTALKALFAMVEQAEMLEDSDE